MRNNSHGEADVLLNARGVTYDDFMRDLCDLHGRVKSWRFVGEVLGVSGAYARLIAQKHRIAGKTVVLRWIEYRAVNKPTRRPRYRARYWRPCLPASLTPEQRAQVVELAATLAGSVPEVLP